MSGQHVGPNQPYPWYQVLHPANVFSQPREESHHQAFNYIIFTQVQHQHMGRPFSQGIGECQHQLVPQHCLLSYSLDRG